MTAIRDELARRPWPLPASPWVMAQIWHDLLFAHWPVSAAELRPLIPAQLEIDLFERQAWLGVVPFRMSGVRFRGTPAMPWLSAFPELNVRTYVVRDGKPGVWFFSLDAGNPLAVAIARAWFHLPYYRARMRCEEQNGRIEYTSERTHSGAPSASFRARYRPVGPVFSSRPGALEHFLTERYCLYSVDRTGQLIRADIHHRPWPLQEAEAQLERNTMPDSLGVRVTGQALLHFAKRQDVVVWRPHLQI